MGREFSLQEALKLAIKAEKDSMDFYRKAASVAKKERTRKVFELLANEEVGHLKAFFEHYKGGEFGDMTSYMNSPVDTKNPTYMKLEKAMYRGNDRAEGAGTGPGRGEGVYRPVYPVRKGYGRSLGQESL